MKPVEFIRNVGGRWTLRLRFGTGIGARVDIPLWRDARGKRTGA